MNAEIEDRELLPMRCRSCGTVIGYRKKPKTGHHGVSDFWCSAGCFDTIMSANQVRDEIAVELYLVADKPVNSSALGRQVGLKRQRLYQVLDRWRVLPDGEHYMRRLARAEYMREWKRAQEEAVS